MTFKPIAGDTFVKWRKEMILKGGRWVDFDWLLDIAAGVSWSKLQNIIVNPEVVFSLEIPIGELEVIGGFSGFLDFIFC